MRRHGEEEKNIDEDITHIGMYVRNTDIWK